MTLLRSSLLTQRSGKCAAHHYGVVEFHRRKEDGLRASQRQRFPVDDRSSFRQTMHRANRRACAYGGEWLRWFRRLVSFERLAPLARRFHAAPTWSSFERA